jgi:hypothetical protein
MTTMDLVENKLGVVMENRGYDTDDDLLMD